MNRHRFAGAAWVTGWVWVGAAAAWGAGETAAGPEEVHPRLLVDAAKIAAIQRQIQTKDSTHELIFRELKDRVDGNKGYGGGKASYLASFRAREAACVSLFSPADGDRKKYADMAFELIKGANVAPGDSVLAGGTVSIGVGLTYDWCYPAWTADQRAKARQQVERLLAWWPTKQHGNMESPFVSNFAGVARGGEMILLLGTCSEKVQADRFRVLKEALTGYFRNTFSDLGHTPEGMGYMEYPLSYALPATFALAGLGDADLLNEAQKRAWWKMAMYTHTFQKPCRRHVMTGVTSGAHERDGWPSLNLNLAPKDQLPYYLWWYDRNAGRLAQPGESGYRFDSENAGALYSLLYYPIGVSAQDPGGAYPAGVRDDHGFCFFRNRWKDENDILVSVTADSRVNAKGWDVPETFALNLMGFDSRFFGGPKKDDVAANISTLLVDGKTVKAARSENLGGQVASFQADAKGGYALLDGGTFYKSLGLKDAQRHLMVDFGLPEGRAVISTLDRLQSDAPHAYVWQGAPGPAHDADNVKASAGQEGGRPFFLLDAVSNGFVKGWVLHPADAEVKADTGPVRISVKGNNADIWVVMLAGPGTAPAATIEGEGLAAKVKIGNLATVRLENGKIVSGK